MKVLIILCLLSLAVAEIKFYTTADDNVDVDALMKIPEKIKYHMDCFVDRRPCEPYSQSYKINMLEAIATACERCNPAQKFRWSRFLAGLQQNYPSEYEAFKQKYDPKNIYMEIFERAVAI